MRRLREMAHVNSANVNSEQMKESTSSDPPDYATVIIETRMQGGASSASASASRPSELSAHRYVNCDVFFKKHYVKLSKF